MKEFIAAWIEVLTLTKYFYGDTVSAGNQEGVICLRKNLYSRIFLSPKKLIYESRILYDRAMVRFRTVPGSNIPGNVLKIERNVKLKRNFSKWLGGEEFLLKT